MSKANNAHFAKPWPMANMHHSILSIKDRNDAAVHSEGY